MANALLRASIDKRPGVLRAAAIYLVWYDATRRNTAGMPVPGNLPRLQSQVLVVSAADTGNQTAMLKQPLASALVNAITWRLSPGVREWLRCGCLTQGCGDATDGRIFLNL